ncbi:hypothetical protein ScPMuIL_004882 [Solemya velum]
MYSDEDNTDKLEENANIFDREILYTQADYADISIPDMTGNQPDYEMSNQHRSEMLASTLFHIAEKEPVRKEKLNPKMSTSIPISNVDMDISEPINFCETLQHSLHHGQDNQNLDLVNNFSNGSSQSQCSPSAGQELSDINIAPACSHGEEVSNKKLKKHDGKIDPFSIESSKWNVKGDFVIQLNGLPASYDLSGITELIGAFGTVGEVDQQCCENVSAIRIRLNSAEECDFVVSCLHDTDCLFPDDNRVIECFRVS